MVPLFDPNPQNAALASGLREAFDSLLASGRFILGPEVEAFEREFAKRIGVPYAVGLSSGTDALLVALMTLDLAPGDEVICPSFTFFATAGSIVRAGGKPVFAEVLPGTFNIDPADVERRITSRTRAIVPVHLYGQAADMDPLMEIAEKSNIAVIEDAAQAFGARYKNREAGSIGTFGAFSFFPTKNLGGLGDGGLLTTNDAALAKKAVILRNHGMDPKYYHQTIGGNFRLHALQAAFLRVKLRHAAGWIEKRRQNAAFYLRRLQQSATGCKSPNDSSSNAQCYEKPILLPHEHADCDHTWNQFTIRVGGGRRDHLKAFLAERQIGSEIYYPCPLHLQECFLSFSEGKGSLPITEAIAGECLSLPIYPEITDAQLASVAEAVGQFLQS